MNEKNYTANTYGEAFPIIRIKKVILNNFKSVEHGEIELGCGTPSFIPSMNSDILGIYGQNGSGKTAFIEALAILKDLMMGYSVDRKYADCVTVGEEYAELEFVFELQYVYDVIREATYVFCLKSREATDEEIQEGLKRKRLDENFVVAEKEKRVEVCNERFYLSWEHSSKKQLIIDTSSKKAPFVPEKKRAQLSYGKKNFFDLEVNKQRARINSKSFIFMNETLDVFIKYTDFFGKKSPSTNTDGSIFCEVLVELQFYALDYLFVITTDSSAFIRSNYALALYSRNKKQLFPSSYASVIEKTEYKDYCKIIKGISIVLEQLVPELTIDIEKLSETLTKEGKPADFVMLVAHRNNKKFPLRYESDGVRRLISFLSLIIAAFNDPSVAVVIDEFDAGIFEYLLGEILKAMEACGKGQFIFTSHNLRPLEVINKKSLCFTTTNPKNRYYRLKNIAATNNLRDTYFRKIMFDEHKEELYKRTNQFKIVDAFIKAGEEDE